MPQHAPLLIVDSANGTGLQCTMTKHVTVYENLRGVVYTPFYLAVAEREWEQLGLSVDVRLSPSTSETAIGLIEGRIDMSWGGPMRVFMHHNSDPNCSLVCFGQVVSRDPFMLVGREPNPNFQFSDLAGVRIAIASDVPTPWLTFQDDLQRVGIDPASLNRATDETMARNVERLRAGEVDVIQVFEPHASAAMLDGVGHLWHRFSTRGDCAFTTFYTTKPYRERHDDVCRLLVKGIHHALAKLYAWPIDDIVAKVADRFPETDPKILAHAIDGYRAANLWAREPSLPPTPVVRLKAALLSGGFIERDIPYDDIVQDVEL